MWDVNSLEYRVYRIVWRFLSKKTMSWNSVAIKYGGSLDPNVRLMVYKHNRSWTNKIYRELFGVLERHGLKCSPIRVRGTEMRIFEIEV